MKTVTLPADIVKKPHFAALTFSAIHIPGDERSQQHPGHGYPAETRAIVEYHAFDCREEMERWAHFEETLPSRRPYQLIEVKPLTVTVQTKVEVA